MKVTMLLASICIAGLFQILIAPTDDPPVFEPTTQEVPPDIFVVTIPVDATTPHLGMLRPGMRVELLLTHSDGSFGPRILKTVKVIEFAEVFSTDNFVYIDTLTNARTRRISLLVPLQCSTAITRAQKIGRLSLKLSVSLALSEERECKVSQEFLPGSLPETDPTVSSRLDELLADSNPFDATIQEARLELLRKKSQQAEAACIEQAARVQQLSHRKQVGDSAIPEQEKNDLRIAVDEAMRAKQDLQLLEIASILLNAEAMKRQLADRERNRSAIIDRRINDLLNPDDQWETNRNP